MTHDYTRKGGIVHAEIMLPAHAPPEFADRSILWNSVEQIEKARDSQLAREIEAALPRELSGEQQLALVRAYVKDNFVDKGMCADFAIHDKGTGNPHVHIMLTLRPLKENGQWGAKCRKAYDLDENGQRTLIPQVKDFDELLRRLQEMGYEIKQGKYISFRAAGQERFTRAKTLGAAYTEEAIKERIKGVYAAKAKTLREDKKIRLVVDIENSIKAQQSAGYERWAKIHNLKQAAKSMNFLTENKIEYYSELESKIADIMTAHDAAAKAVKEVEQRMSDLSLLIKHTTTYRQLKPIYDEYRKSPDKEKYLRGHESEIILFEAAARALKEMQIKKLPDLAALRKEYSSLNDRKSKLYEDYRQAKKQMQEYGVVKKNVDSILYPSQSRTKEQERG